MIDLLYMVFFSSIPYKYLYLVFVVYCKLHEKNDLNINNWIIQKHDITEQYDLCCFSSHFITCDCWPVLRKWKQSLLPWDLWGVSSVVENSSSQNPLVASDWMHVPHTMWGLHVCTNISQLTADAISKSILSSLFWRHRPPTCTAAVWADLQLQQGSLFKNNFYIKIL